MESSTERPIGTHTPGTLRREIVVALSIKVLLLFGLWLLIFRSGEEIPRGSGDIADRLFATPPPSPLPNHHGRQQLDPNFVRPLTQEVRHVQ